MWIDTVYEIAKSTLTGWEVEPTYSSGLVEAMCGYPSNTNFSVEIEVQSEDVIGLTTYVLIDGIFSYSANMEIYSLEDSTEGLRVNLVSREPVFGNFKFSYVQPKPNLQQPFIKCVGKVNLGRRDNLVVFNEFNILFKNEDEAIEFLKVIVICANHVKIGAEKLDESIEEVTL